MIDFVTKLGFSLFLTTVFPWLCINVYLSLKLRTKKHQMIDSIAMCGPKKFRNRAKLLMESNVSWVFASSFSHIWFVYIILRYLWGISENEISEWQAKIYSIYGEQGKLHRLSARLVNVTIVGFVLILCSLVVS